MEHIVAVVTRMDGKEGYRLQSDKIKKFENAVVAVVVLYYIGVRMRWWEI